MSVRTSDVCAIIPAAGLGYRMQSKCPKQYLIIGKKTILEHTIATLLKHPRISHVIIVINPDDIYFDKLSLTKNNRITKVNGGKKRVNSVLAGIQAAHNSTWVLIHDAVRPCLHLTDLTQLLMISETNSTGGILATPVRDTIKRAKINKNIIACTIERLNLWHALTPQFFLRDLLNTCLLRAIKEGATITDEASALEYCGFYPKLVKGRADNIKITHPEDLLFAEFYLKYLKNRNK